MSSLFARKLRVRPTANGVVFILSLAVIFLLSINYSNNLIFTFCFLLAAVMAVSLWMLLRNILGVSAHCAGADSVHAGQKLIYPVALEIKDGATRYQLSLNKQGSVAALQSTEHSLADVQVEAPKRGRHAAPNVKLSSRWPLGLFEGAIELCPLPEVLIYPEAINAQPLVLRSEGQQAHQQDASDSLDGLREYQPGDNLRRVHWRAMARNDQLQVKQFDGEEGEPSGWLCWDDTAGMPYERRISCLTHWILEYFHRGGDFGLSLPGQKITPNRGSAQLHACLSALALMPGAEK